MKLLHTSHDLILIDRIKQALAEAGIPFFVRNENPVGQAAGEVPPVVAWPEVFVKDASMLSEAKKLIAMLEEKPNRTNLAWTCPACGEHLEPQFQQCWSCQSERKEKASN